MITINTKARTLEVTKGFAAKAKKFGTDEYKELREARKDFPTYKVVTKEVKSKDNFKGMTYEYMKKYIEAHDENGTIMATFKDMRAKSENAEDAMAVSMSYGEIKSWFLDTYPEIKQFHEAREERIEAIRKKKAAEIAEKAKNAA